MENYTTFAACAECAHYKNPPYLGPGIIGPGTCEHPDAIERMILAGMEEYHPAFCPLADKGNFSGTLGVLAARYVNEVKDDIRFMESPKDVDEPKSTAMAGRDIDIECAFIFDDELLDYLRRNMPDERYAEMMSFVDTLMFGDGFCGWADTSLSFVDMTPNPIVDMKFSGGTTRDTVVYRTRGKEKSWFDAAYLGPQDMILEDVDFFKRWIIMPADFDYPRHIVDIHGTVMR